MTLGTNLRNLSDFKNNLVVEGPDFSRREEALTNGTDIAIGLIVTKFGETQPDIDLCGEDEMIFGIVEGYTNKDEVDSNGYWYRDPDVPFGNNKWVIVGILVPGQIVWVVSATAVSISRGAGLKVVDGYLQMASTGDDITFTAEESVTGVAGTNQYFRAKVVKA